MNVEQSEAMIEAACAWWGREMGIFHDMNSEAALNASGLEVVLMTLYAPRPDASAAEKVVKELRSILRQYADVKRYANFGVDYDPQDVLYDAIKAAGNPRVSLPFKTRMWVDWDRCTVVVKKGYGGTNVTIYPNTIAAEAAEGDE